jgi:hypothetical protein
MKRAAIALLAMLLAACTGEVSPLGVAEPIVVHRATLRRAPMPGAADAEGPRVTSLETTGGVFRQGQLGRTMSGRVSEEAWAIALSVVGLGSGHWVLPVGGLDPAFPGERVWDVELDINGGLPPGVHTVRLAALDEAGVAGAWRDLDICVVDPRVPDGFNACDPTLPPPDAVIVLTWDTDVDLDLVVETPDGKIVDARRPTTVSTDRRPIPAEVLRQPGIGRLDGDSHAECLPDGRNSESLTFLEPAAVPGLYLVYVNLFDACHEPSVRFAVTTYRREEQAEGGFRLAQVEQRTGMLLGLSANGGAGAPLYVTAVDLP